MLSSLAEGLIQRVCGRYLKNFTSDNVHISVTGIITLSNIELNVDELSVFQFPYPIAKVLIGCLYADLPIVLGGNCEIRVSNVLVLLSNSSSSSSSLLSSSSSSVGVDVIHLQKALQAWIGVLFFAQSAQAQYEKPMLTTSEIEYSQKLFDRLILKIENVHVRIEDEGLVHNDVVLEKETEIKEEVYCTGLLIGTIELRGPTTRDELDRFADLKASQSIRATSQCIDKLFYCKDMSVYMTREECVGMLSDGTKMSEFIKKYHYLRSDAATILQSFNFDVYFMCAYQRSNLVFGPILAKVNSSDIHVHISDEQIAFLISLIRSIDDQNYKLKTRTRLAHCRECVDRQRRARLRWGMIRDWIKQDWWKYCNDLVGGRLRWKSWFQQWILAARYVAIREILLFYTGYEALRGVNGDVLSHSFSESLNMDHHYRDVESLKQLEEASGGMTRKQKRRYQGPGMFTEEQMETAEEIVEQVFAYKTQATPYFRRNPSYGADLALMQPLEKLPDPAFYTYAPTDIRCLYALQLELDTILPLNVSALCRVWAEELYRAKVVAMSAANGGGTAGGVVISNVGASIDDEMIASSSMTPNRHIHQNSSISGSVAASLRSEVVLVAVVDASGLKPSFGMSAVEAYCSIDIFRAGGSAFAAATEAKSSKVYQPYGTGCVGWAEVFEFGGDSTSSQSTLKLECSSKGLFAPCYGQALVPMQRMMSSALSPTFNDATDIPIVTHNFHLSTKAESASREAGKQSTSNSTSTSVDAMSTFLSVFSMAGEAANAAAGGNSNTDVPVIRVMTMHVIGGDEIISKAKSRLSVRAKEAFTDNIKILERQHQLALHEANQSGREEDEQFILDPSLLTLQDMQANLSVGRISITVSAAYDTPASVLTAAKKVSVKLQPKLQVPLVRFDVSGISVQANASNNPWSGSGKASVDNIKITKLGLNKSDHCNLLNIPAVSLSLSVSQVSTMSRFIDGNLDLTCFDWDATFNLDPVSLRLKPQLFASSSASSVASANPDLSRQGGRYSIWKTTHFLEHLWLPQSGWSVGTGNVFSSIISGCFDPKLSDEVATRIGDGYEMFPKYLNTPREVSLSKLHVGETASAVGGLTRGKSELQIVSPQQTSIIINTDSSQCTVQLLLNPAIQDLQAGANALDSDEEWDETIQAKGLDSDSDEDVPPKITLTKQSTTAASSGAVGALASGVEAGFSGLVGGVAGGLDAGVNSMFGWVSFGAAPAPSQAPKSSTSAPAPSASGTSANALSRMSVQQLQNRIRELEEQNAALLRENNRLRR